MRDTLCAACDVCRPPALNLRVSETTKYTLHTGHSRGHASHVCRVTVSALTVSAYSNHCLELTHPSYEGQWCSKL